MDIKTYFTCDENEKPLDRYPSDGGYCAILRTIGCIGDSLSSGEMQILESDGKNHYYDLFDYSWGQGLARITGNTVYNFSRGGMTTKEYCESFASSQRFWDRTKACKAYIVALGVNDATKMLNGEMEFGSFDDIDFTDWHNNKHTFCGYYAQILQRYREISPKARLFLMTEPKENCKEERNRLYDKQREFMLELTKKFDFCYLLDFRTYAPVYDEDFHKKFYMRGHLNPMGYELTAKFVVSYLDYIIRHNPDDFFQIGLIDQEKHDVEFKW